ncbi:MAG: 50S ribosomal protein L32, partial [Patescibacteria group bacterium]
RRSQQALKKRKLLVCKNCGGPVIPHKTCLNCGNYNSRKKSI